jgi:hypothetical protein
MTAAGSPLGGFKDAKIHKAIHESVPWEDHPLPPRPADLETSA